MVPGQVSVTDCPLEKPIMLKEAYYNFERTPQLSPAFMRKNASLGLSAKLLLVHDLPDAGFRVWG